MKKIFILLVGLSLSLSAVTFEELPSVGKLNYTQDCGFRCDATGIVPQLSGRVYVDAIVFGKDGKLTDQNPYMKAYSTVNFRESADTVITIRPVAVDEEAGAGMLNYALGAHSNTWKIVDTNMTEKHTENGGTSGAILAGGMSNAGMSNTASAGAGVALFLLSSKSPHGSFLYSIKITKNGQIDEYLLKMRNQDAEAALYNVVKNLIFVH